MNSRVAELLKQSTDNILGVNVVDQQKFARLLIEECAYVARQCRVVRANDAEDVAQEIERRLKHD